LAHELINQPVKYVAKSMQKEIYSNSIYQDLKMMQYDTKTNLNKYARCYKCEDDAELEEEK